MLTQMTNVSELQPNPHKVFISFRGKKMRHGFMSFLKAELQKSKIHYIMDDDELRGYFISIVFKRIKESNVALVIITEYSTESRWCLDELVVMKKQMEAGYLVIMPVFYHIGAGTVQNQKGWFGNRLLKTENDARMKVNRSSIKDILDTEAMIREWREALICVGGIMGIHYQHKSDKDFVTEIVVDLKQRLESMEPRTDHIVAEKPLVYSQEEIGSLTTLLQALKLKDSDIEDLIHSKTSNNDINGCTDHRQFLDLNSLNGGPVLVQQLIEQGQAGRIVLVLLGSLECSYKGYDIKSLVLPKNCQQLGFLDKFGGGESSDNSGNRTDGERCFSFLSCILEAFAMRTSSPSVFISFGEKKLGKTLVSYIKREMELSKISWVEKESHILFRRAETGTGPNPIKYWY